MRRDLGKVRLIFRPNDHHAPQGMSGALRGGNEDGTILAPSGATIVGEPDVGKLQVRFDEETGFAKNPSYSTYLPTYLPTSTRTISTKPVATNWLHFDGR